MMSRENILAKFFLYPEHVSMLSKAVWQTCKLTFWKFAKIVVCILWHCTWSLDNSYNAMSHYIRGYHNCLKTKTYLSSSDLSLSIFLDWRMKTGQKKRKEQTPLYDTIIIVHLCFSFQRCGLTRKHLDFRVMREAKVLRSDLHQTI